MSMSSSQVSRRLKHVKYKACNSHSHAAGRRTSSGLSTCRATDSEATASTSMTMSSLQSLVKTAADAQDVYAASTALRDGMMDMKEKGQGLSMWGMETGKLMRRNVFNNEIKRLGVKGDVAKLATPSVRDDASFLALWVLGSSVIATLGYVIFIFIYIFIYIYMCERLVLCWYM